MEQNIEHLNFIEIPSISTIWFTHVYASQGD